MRESNRRWFGPKTIAAFLVLVAFFLGKSGLGNGDIAAYIAQIHAGDLTERWVHIGYIIFGSMFSWSGDRLPAILNIFNTLFGAAFVVLVSETKKSFDGLICAGMAAILVLPWALYAEVDLLWIVTILIAARENSSRWILILTVIIAVSVSPAAGLAIPWLVVRRGALPVISAGLTIGLLSIASHGDWWWGERGILETSFTLEHSAKFVIKFIVISGGWWWVGRLWRQHRLELLACIPLLFAPTDVPAWLIGVAAFLPMLSTKLRHLSLFQSISISLLPVAVSLMTTYQTHQRVVNEQEQIHQILANWTPDTGLIAPWSFGVRASVLATGDPYRLKWRVIGHPIRDQASHWCENLPHRVVVFPGNAELMSWCRTEFH